MIEVICIMIFFSILLLSLASFPLFLFVLAVIGFAIWVYNRAMWGDK
ncbi:hypothetical protein ES705_20534 [subsurface metagenome]